MATVYLAHDVRHDRKVALKVLRPELSAILGAERFLREIKTTANLQHPHILSLFDSGEADGLVFYVMPYVEGEIAPRPAHPREAAAGGRGGADHAGGGRRAGLRPPPRRRCTATSSPRTSCCTTATRWWRTSASRWPPALGGRHADDRDRDDARHAALHESRAGDGRARDHGAERRLRAGLRAVRDAGGGAAVHGPDGAGDHRAGDDRGAALAHAAAPDDPAARRGGGAHGAREAPGRPVRHGRAVRRGARQPDLARRGPPRRCRSLQRRLLWPAAPCGARRSLASFSVAATTRRHSVLRCSALRSTWAAAPRRGIGSPRLAIVRGRRMVFIGSEGGDAALWLREVDQDPRPARRGTRRGTPFFSPDGANPSASSFPGAALRSIKVCRRRAVPSALLGAGIGQPRGLPVADWGDDGSGSIFRMSLAAWPVCPRTAVWSPSSPALTRQRASRSTTTPMSSRAAGTPWCFCGPDRIGSKPDRTHQPADRRADRAHRTDPFARFLRARPARLSAGAEGTAAGRHSSTLARAGVLAGPPAARARAMWSYDIARTARWSSPSRRTVRSSTSAAPAGNVGIVWVDRSRRNHAGGQHALSEGFVDLVVLFAGRHSARPSRLRVR